MDGANECHRVLTFVSVTAHVIVAVDHQEHVKRKAMVDRFAKICAVEPL